MEIQLDKFKNSKTFSILVNYPEKLKNVKTTSSYGYVTNEYHHDKISAVEFLKKFSLFSEEKILQALQLVKLKSSIFYVSMQTLTRLEQKKVELALALLLQSKVLICENFFEEMSYNEQDYFKRLFRNMMHKKNVSIILIEKNMNFVCETVKSFYLFTSNGKYKFIEDFYNEEIYQYVQMPFTVELVKYLESCGHKIDHDVTFNETLKAIYRGVESKN